MRAGAISVLAGAKVLVATAHGLLLPRAFVLGVCMTLSAFCTWLIPLLLALGVWRHVLRRLPLRYETSLWSVVFSLGMYAVASRSLGDASGRHWLADAGRIEIWPAVAVWAAVFAAMLVAPARPVRPPRPPHGSTAAG